MKHDKLKISRMSEELINYLFSIGAGEISINIKEDDTKYIISAECKKVILSEEESKRIKRIFKIEKSEEMEEYYWCLAGESDVDTELSLLSMMADKSSIAYDDEVLSIVLYRNK